MTTFEYITKDISTFISALLAYWLVAGTSSIVIFLVSTLITGWRGKTFTP